MSGICAIWQKDNRLPDLLILTAKGLALHESERLAHCTAGCGGVAASIRFPTQQIFESDRLLLACDADLYGIADDADTAGQLARLYEQNELEFVEKLRGSFSVVLWDKRDQRLIAAVDGFGIHRLVYVETSGTLLIASRLGALAQMPGLSTEVNPRAIANCLNFGVNLGEETIFRGVRRLPPGALLIASEGTIRVRRYWDMSYEPGDRSNEAHLSRELEDVVEKAVAANCGTTSFTDLGAYLSGGTDSSTVVGMMDRLERGPVQAFSVGFEEQHFDELEYARITARKFQAQHYTHRVTADDCLEALPHMVRCFDEPFANSSAIPTYFCARLAAQHGVKVLLAGDGGDELFGGNERYRTDKIFHLYQTLPRPLRKRFVEPFLEVAPIGIARRYVRRSNLEPCERYFSYNFLCAHPIEEVLNPDFLRALDGYSLLEIPSRYYRHGPARDHLDRLLYVDVKITLGDSDLPKVTYMSELAGIRTRFPFLDRDVAELSGRIPSGLKLKRFNKRYLFKRAFRNLLPAEVIQKKKHGFGIPVALWLKTDKRLRDFSRDVLFSARARQRGYFRPEFLEKLVRKHEADDSTYYGDTIWSFFVLELWHRQFVDQPISARSIIAANSSMVIS